MKDWPCWREYGRDGHEQHMTLNIFRLTAAATLTALSWAQPARAEECAPSIEADAALQRRFPELPAQVRDVLDSRHDLERCARVDLRLSPALITVEVTLADGRATSRSVHRGQDVLPVIEALLLIPELTAAAVDSEPSAPADESAPLNAEPRASPARSKPMPARAAPRRWSRRFEPDVAAAVSIDPDAQRFALEFSAVGGARLGLDRTSVGLGVLSLCDLWGWLVAFEGRANSYSAEQQAAPLTTLQLSLLTGRRFRFASMALDLLAGPAVALRDASTTQGPSDPRTDVASGVLPRFVLASHLSFAERSPVRGFIGFEGEFGPGGRQTQNDAARLPAWMAGIALGATVGTR